MKEHAAVMKLNVMVAATVLLGVPTAALAQDIQDMLSPTTLFEGNATTPAPTGQPQPVFIRIQSWFVRDNNGAMQEFPLSGFYVVQLLSGKIAATIDGQTTEHAADAFWTVKTGSTMRVKVLGEAAILQTIVVAKP
jgi:hypothetical protein